MLSQASLDAIWAKTHFLSRKGATVASIGDIVVNLRVEQEPSLSELTWRERLWLRLFRRLPVRSELRREARPLRTDVQVLKETVVKLEKRVKVLECQKHVYQFESYTKPSLYEYSFGDRDRFDFRCKHCGHQIQKTADELTLDERRALGDLHILPPLPTTEAIKKAVLRAHKGGVVKLQEGKRNR